MWRVVIAVALACACKASDGGSCSSYDDCDSGICGSGVCQGGECPCDDGWTCTPGNCDFFGCDGICRQACTLDTDCPIDQRCKGAPDTDGTYCIYEEPRFPIDPGGPYVGRVGEPITMTATVELTGNYEIQDNWSFWTPTSSRVVELVGEKRIEGNTMTADMVFWSASQRVQEVQLSIVDPQSHADPNQRFYSHPHAFAKLQLSCSPDGGPCIRYGSCCAGQCIRSDGSVVTTTLAEGVGTCR